MAKKSIGDQSPSQEYGPWNLRLAREAAGKTLKEAAEYVRAKLGQESGGLSAGTLEAWENMGWQANERGSFCREAYPLAELYGVQPEDLYGRAPLPAERKTGQPVIVDEIQRIETAIDASFEARKGGKGR